MPKIVWEGTTPMGSTIHFRIVLHGTGVYVERKSRDAMGMEKWDEVDDNIALKVLEHHLVTYE